MRHAWLKLTPVNSETGKPLEDTSLLNFIPNVFEVRLESHGYGTEIFQPSVSVGGGEKSHVVSESLNSVQVAINDACDIANMPTQAGGYLRQGPTPF
jgi:hypothetical protein